MKIIDANTVQLTATYTEPTYSGVNTLDHTNVWYQIGTATPVMEPNVPASSPTGGKLVTTTINVPVSDGTSVTFMCWATDTNNLGKTSAPSNEMSVTVDRTVPQPPTGFTIA